MSIRTPAPHLRTFLGVVGLGIVAAGACDSSGETADGTHTGGKSGAGGALGGTTAAGTGGSVSGSGGSGATSGSGGSGPLAGRAGVAGSAGSAGVGGGLGGEGGGGGAGGAPDGDCGDPNGQGVVVFEDVSENATWNCPKYTLTHPIFVRSSGSDRTTLTISAGVKVAGVKGDLDAGRLPGALIVTRSGRLSAVGRANAPIVFSSAEPVGMRAPGDWGGVVLLGRALTNVPANFESSGNAAGEMYIEGLPRTELATYGRPFDGGGGGTGGMGGDPEGEDWDCGTLDYVRIEFAGFEVAPTRELNGLTLGACGRETVIDHVQVHLGKDDGVELFGGATDLKHVVITGPKDDGLDWDQGWSGRAQFVVIQMHDDTARPATDRGDCGIEADGYADPVLLFGDPSSPRIFNLTLIGSATSTRGMRLRDGTQAFVRNALVLADPASPATGLVDVNGATSANWITAQSLTIQNTVFSGQWPAAGVDDGQGNHYTPGDFFIGGAGDVGNDEVANVAALLPVATSQTAPNWIPGNASAATMNAIAPIDVSGVSAFFDAGATYRGAFVPGGADWTAGWTAYPAN